MSDFRSRARRRISVHLRSDSVKAKHEVHRGGAEDAEEYSNLNSSALQTYRILFF